MQQVGGCIQHWHGCQPYKDVSWGQQTWDIAQSHHRWDKMLLAICTTYLIVVGCPLPACIMCNVQAPGHHARLTVLVPLHFNTLLLNAPRAGRNTGGGGARAERA